MRVATVALNPSRLEFPTGDAFRRFPAAAAPAEDYLSALRRYFLIAPYRSWFAFYEEALSGIDVSYYPGRSGTAVHTDIASVLPTNPTWGRLPRTIRDRLAVGGVPLWHDLIERLQPELLLWSTARSWLSMIGYAPEEEWNELITFDRTEGGERRKRPVVVSTRWHRLRSGLPMLVAFVPASQKPLGALSHRQKANAGAAILERWRRDS